MKTFRSRCVQGLALTVACLLLSLVPVASLRAADSAERAASRLKKAVKYLASDDLRGRGIETEGLDQAAEYIRDEFSDAGLDVTAAGGNAFQAFEIVTGSKLTSPNTLEFAGPDEKTIAPEHGQDFRTCSFGAAGSFEGQLVFCGYGIHAPKKDYNDFADVDLEGKIAIIMRRVPRQDDSDGPFSGAHGRISRHADLRTKLSNAYSRGAAAVLFVTDPHTVRERAEKAREQVEKAEDEVVAAAEALNDTDPQEDRDGWQQARDKLAKALRTLQAARKQIDDEQADDELMKFGYGGHAKGDTIPVMHIRQTLCNRLLRASLDKTLTEIEQQIDESLEPQSTVLEGWTVRGETSLERTRSRIKNVVGALEGEGPHAEETIVIGAHYDHLGLGGPGSLAPKVKEVHNGADDNASGTAALIELARRLGAREEPLARRVVFIAFTGEERGLLGSAHYVKNPVFPLEKTVAMFNMDMVGRLRDDKLTVFGSGTAERWEKTLKKLGEQHELNLTLKPGGFGPSDHSSFYAKKISVLHLFTGTHGDYHRPGDDWDKVNYGGMARVVAFLEEMVLRTAGQAETPQYVAIKRKTPQRSGSRPYFGSIPDFGSQTDGYAISGVSPGSPADKAGLKGGDSIVKLGEYKIGGLEDFDLALRKYSPGDEVKVVVQRDGEKKTLKVTLAEPK